MLGDKEIAVQIRGNSHYRNWVKIHKSECLSVCDPIKTLGQIGETVDLRYGRVSLFSHASTPSGEVLYFYPFDEKRKEKEK